MRSIQLEHETLWYTPLSIDCNLCDTNIAQCIRLGLPPSWEFDLYVGKSVWGDARYMLLENRGLLRPVIRLTCVPELDPYEWAVFSNGVGFGSKGV